jgi:putative hemolysin
VTGLLLLIGTILALALSALSSGMETGVYCASRVRLRVRSQQRRARARRLWRLMQRPEDLVITTLAGTNIADYLCSAFVAALLIHAGVTENLAELYATAVLTPLVLVFGGIIPKDWFQREADRLMTLFSLPLDVMRRVFAALGLIRLLRGLTYGLLRWIDPERLQRERELLPRFRVQRLLIEGATAGGLTPFQRDTMERVLRMSQRTVREIMVPRQRAATIPIDMPREEVLRITQMAHFSRLPVYRDDPRRIVGVLNVYDVLMDERERPVQEHVRDPLYISIYETAPRALRRMQRARQVMAIVTDLSGHCVGLFTMKDLVECVVGDIEAW